MLAALAGVSASLRPVRGEMADPPLDALAKDAATALSGKGFFVLDNFLGSRFGADARLQAEALDAAGHLKPGKISKGLTLEEDTKVRGDRIIWLKHTNLAGTQKRAEPPAGKTQQSNPLVGHATLEMLLEKLDQLRALIGPEIEITLNMATYMLACYPGAGTGYVRHRDASPEHPGRRVTAIYYLNPDWVDADGGQLRIWPNDAGGDDIEHATLISPLCDRLLLFTSTLEHEVTPSFNTRFALTSWFYNRSEMQAMLLHEEKEKSDLSDKMAARKELKELMARMMAKKILAAAASNKDGKDSDGDQEQ